LIVGIKVLAIFKTSIKLC